MLHKILEQKEQNAAQPYENHDYGLFKAIQDENIDAINGLIKFFRHKVNCKIEGGGYRGYAYSDTPTPLSYAIHCGKPSVVKHLIALGANKDEHFAKKEAAASKSSEIQNLFRPQIGSVEANDLSSLNDSTTILGKKLEKAFHDKHNVDQIRRLVELGAPVNIRLDYGLEVKLESEFVAEFFLLLEGDKGEEQLLANAKTVLGDNNHARGLVAYLNTALEIFTLLRSNQANLERIPLTNAFTKFLKENAANARANPDSKNGALIIAAGLRDPKLVQEIIDIGKKSTLPPEENGAHIEFKGYFDDTAAVWSAILLDAPTLKVLLDNGSNLKNIGITDSSLLHWVVLASRLDQSTERQEKAMTLVKLLLTKGAKANIKNKLGKTPLDYARGELKEFLNASMGITKSNANKKDTFGDSLRGSLLDGFFNASKAKAKASKTLSYHLALALSYTNQISRITR